MGDVSNATFTDSTRANLPSKHPTRSFWQTSHPNALVNERTTAELPPDADIIVIGSGITAVFAVRELLESSKSLRIVVLEARTTCSGATGRNGGHCQPIVHEQKADIIDFELANFRRLEGLISDNNVPCDWHRLSGCIGFWSQDYFEKTKEEVEERHRSHPKSINLVKVVDDADDLVELRLKNACGATVQSTAATLSPYKLVIWLWQDMLDRYSSKTLNIQTTTPVTKIEHLPNGNDHYVCQTPRGAITSKHVILAVNGYTSYLLPGFEHLIRPVQGQMSALDPPASFAGQLLERSYGFLGTGKKDRVMSDYLHQRSLESGGHFMFGGARDCVAKHGEGVSDDSYVDLDAEDRLRHLPERLDLATPTEASKSMPISDTLDISASWTGVMGYSKDDFPWVGGVPNSEGLWLCGGYTGHGMTNASGCGEHIARVVLAAVGGKDWRESEHEAIVNGSFPREYVLTTSRYARTLADNAD